MHFLRAIFCLYIQLGFCRRPFALNAESSPLESFWEQCIRMFGVTTTCKASLQKSSQGNSTTWEYKCGASVSSMYILSVLSIARCSGSIGILCLKCYMLRDAIYVYGLALLSRIVLILLTAFSQDAWLLGQADLAGFSCISWQQPVFHPVAHPRKPAGQGEFQPFREPPHNYQPGSCHCHTPSKSQIDMHEPSKGLRLRAL